MDSRKLTGLTAFLLSVLMMISICTVGVTASAATDDGDSVASQGVNVTVKSNIFPEFTKSFDADTDTLTVSYYIQCEKDMLNSQWALTYDPTVLRFNPSKNILDDDNEVRFMPQATDCVSNYEVPDHPEMILGNCSRLSLYKLSTKEGGRVPFVTATFDVIGSGDTTVNLNLEIMQIAKVDSKTHLVDAATEEDVVEYDKIFDTSVPIVRESYVYAGKYSDDPYPVEEPTTEPTTAPATTEPTTAEPTTAPVTEPTQPATEPTTATQPTQPQSGVSVTGDIALPLADDGNGIYTGSTELEAGSYTFKMNVNGVAFGNGSTFTDKTTNATYSSKWTSSTTLKATGGKYTFKFNTAKNTLTIEYLAPSKASIVGDINLDLQATKDANVYSASVKLNKGNYEFRVMNQGVRYCCGYTFKDFTVGSQYNSKWSSASTLAASGGTYTFSYDIDTNKLTISYLPSGAEVSVVGNFTLVLAKTDKENVYSGTKTLKAGNYQIKMNNYGKLCGTSAVVKDATPGLVFNPKWSKYTTFVATGGTYTFTYNTATNTLVVTADKGDIPVKVTGDIDLTLTKSDTNVFTGSVKLKRGDYSFKMNVNGTDFCSGATIRNATTGTVKYNSKFTSASTLVAIGGTYTFTYNALTNQLSVKYSK